MTVLVELKAKALELRKARHSVAPKITFAISEIEKVGKNAGNRETTNDEAIKVVQKLVSVIDENLKHASEIDMIISLKHEKQILMSVLPTMLTSEQISELVEEMLTVTLNKGEIMKQLKAKYGALIDLKIVNELLKDSYGI